MSIIEKFIADLGETRKAAEKLKGSLDQRMATSSIDAMEQAIRRSEKIFFRTTTMRMLKDKFEHLDQTLKELEPIKHQFQPFILPKEGWLFVFEIPIDLEITKDIAGFLWFAPVEYIKDTGKDDPLILLIDQSGKLQNAIVAPLEGKWHYDKMIHMCQWQQCHGSPFCGNCKEYLVTWSKIIGLCLVIYRQYLAEERYEEYHESSTRRVPRKHGGKKRNEHVTHTYKSIDASEIVLRQPETEALAPAGKENNEGWLARALGEGRVEYREVQTRPFSRTYRSDRYRESGLWGTTVQFPEGIKQNRPTIKGQEHITNVTARKYELQSND